MIGKLKGNLKDMTKSRDGKEWLITFSTPDNFSESFDELYGKPITVEIKRFYERRSLDANAMAWSMINKIAEKLQQKEPKHGWTPIEVYKDAIRHVAGACSIHCVPDGMVEDFVRDWNSLGIGFQAEVSESKIEGCKTCYFWKGSHLYNTVQMSTLINILIQQAEENNIPTISEEEEKRLLGEWKKTTTTQTAKTVEK